ncbi:DUF4134 family protein [Mucilaginibacter sp. SJ]|uniref:DUF4134 family protein n=1 Tax=Mucilaginibacter sp. SJ TaxID=3029053 RepID=UPI0023A9B601|nr:DUF4134 family protein [Mucilaginibacter sp. SJ]WEA01732.1 DUF4134 family protein [Mucilaginibacter sp. SJ]
MKRLLACMIALYGPLVSLAQPGIAEMQQASQDLRASFFSAFDLSLVLATLLGLIGAVKIYNNWQMGERRIDAAIAAWFYAAIFMVLAGAFLSALFGI